MLSFSAQVCGLIRHPYAKVDYEDGDNGGEDEENGHYVYAEKQVGEVGRLDEGEQVVVRSAKGEEGFPETIGELVKGEGNQDEHDGDKDEV